jgi:hypothetical protein
MVIAAVVVMLGGVPVVATKNLLYIFFPLLVIVGFFSAFMFKIDSLEKE